VKLDLQIFLGVSSYMVPNVGQSQTLARNRSHPFTNLILVILVTLDDALTSQTFSALQEKQ